jgi:hypothetical protein
MASVAGTRTALTTANLLGRNGSQNIRDSENRHYTVYLYFGVPPSCLHILRWSERKQFCSAQILGSSQPFQERFTVLVSLFVQIVSAANESYDMGRTYLFPIDTSPCPALPDTCFYIAIILVQMATKILLQY